MDRLAHKRINIARRAYRVGARMHGTAQRPRLSVYISNTHVTAQLIDDDRGVTLAAASSIGKKSGGSLAEKAAQVGKDIAAQAKKVKIKQAIFDRGSRKYHGRVKALADAARAEGMEF